MLEWILTEYRYDRSIFGIPESQFYYRADGPGYQIFETSLGTSIGPAAGPHTQLAQNIVAAYLAGGRFFELKTIQVLDHLQFPKPCIAAPDEGYNTEWSTELSIEEAFAEYVKAWLILHLLQAEIFHRDRRDFVFNMSVGYDLDGIRSPKVNAFIDGLKDAGCTAVFTDCISVLRGVAGRFSGIDRRDIDAISPHICNSVTLSTMHGCPPAEIEAICRHLLREKKLHTLVKLNPTLLGYEFVRSTLDRMGYCNVQIRDESFSHDLQYADGVAMIGRLKAFAGARGREFGVKLANTLPVKIVDSQLQGEEMYLSGRPVYPLTINLAYRLAAELAGDLQISYSGGADFFNLEQILATGIRPVTMATTLLKPGGYTRLRQMAVAGCR
jgi:putative selenate reductase